jgi:hypothetical protein
LLQHTSSNVDLSDAVAQPTNQEGNAGLGKRASLNEDGYKQVANIKDDKEMTEFIHRVVDKYDLKVQEEAGLQGLVPWFSGTTSVQNMEQLENTVLYAVLTSSKKPWIVYKNSEHVNGDTAELNSVGYVKIAAMKDDSQMQSFARRTCDKLGINIINKDGFAGMVRYYSGTDNFQSFDKLQNEIKSAAKAPNSWASPKEGVQKDKHEDLHEHDKEKNSKASLSESAEVHTVEQPVAQPAYQPPAQASGPADPASLIGDSADLNFQGYVRVASSRNGDAMKKFARRIVQKLRLTITNEGGFEGMMRFFIGPQNFQSYEKLESDIKKAGQEKLWCKQI